MEELKNVMEDLVLDAVEKAMGAERDVCRCEQCRIDVIAYALNRLPPKYVTTDVGSIYTVIEQTKNEYQLDVKLKVEEAIEAIYRNPRHQLETKLIYGEDQAFRILLEKIFSDRGLDCRQYQEKCLKRRIAVRMRARRVRSYAEYLRILLNDQSEYEEFFNTLTINVSEFFRNPETFQAFKELVLRPLIKQKKEQNVHSIKIWSAGCAGGEEPYSIAMILREELSEDTWNCVSAVYGTDIDKEILQFAKKAEYEPRSVEKVSKIHLAKYFDYINGIYKLTKEIKNMVRLQQNNLLNDKPPASFDVIFCRNVMIYFTKDVQDKLYKKFYAVLNPGGYLVSGKVEMLSQQGLKFFKRVSARERIYQKMR
ncbi:MAG: CheR family methyltransferase [bacterium]